MWHVSLVPRPFPRKAWGLLRAHARKISFIFHIIRRKISDNDVIVHGESARKEYADTFVYPFRFEFVVNLRTF